MIEVRPQRYVCIHAERRIYRGNMCFPMATNRSQTIHIVRKKLDPCREVSVDSSFEQSCRPGRPENVFLRVLGFLMTELGCRDISAASRYQSRTHDTSATLREAISENTA